MECPICHNTIEIGLFTVELNAEEDGVEVGCTCPLCDSEIFAVIPSNAFMLVD